MRFFEIIIAGALLMALVGRLIPGVRNRTLFTTLPFLAGLLIPFHLIFEGYRWQMVPLYVITGAYMVISLLPAYRESEKKYFVSNRLLRIIINTLLFLLYLAALIFPVLLPVVNLPAPGGPYVVGKSCYRMVDQNRKELFSADPQDVRELLVTIWYPAEKKAGISRDTYWDKKGITGREFSISAEIGTFWYSHLSLVKTNSYPQAPPSSDLQEFPVILYSHSFYGLNTENTMLIEELASQGYIIASIAHTYENIVSLFPDGEYIAGDLDHIAQLYDSHADKETQLYEDYKVASDRDQKISLTRQILKIDDQSTQMMKIRTEDALFVMDQLENLNRSPGLLHLKLDLNRVGIMGWSYGGATAMEACLADRRFQAAVNVDGWPYGELFNTGKKIAQPLMLIRNDDDDEMEGIIGDLMMESVESDGYMLVIENARHANFWDFPLFFKIYKYFDYWGPLDPLRLLDIEKLYVRGFFDRYLKGKPVVLPENPSERFPEVSVFRKSSDSIPKI